MSTRQLSDQLVALRLLAMMDEHGVDPSRMRIETPESSFQADSTPLRNLETFHRAGVRVFLDNFGTGHSSITVMHRFPVAGIKIDGSFVRPEVDEDFVRLVVGVAQTLDIETVAEGIETAEQLDAVRALGVDYAQGFLLGRPSPSP
jgi:EAL domain-containing protein (putative c-di-GMP-specific phosphodiesterase class I)